MTIPSLITIDEACARLRVGYAAIYSAVKRGKIAAYKPGKEILLDEESLCAWFEASKIKPRVGKGRPRNTTITNI